MVEQLLQEQLLNSCGVIGTVTEVGEIGCSWTRGWAALVERSLFRTNICKSYVSPNTYTWCRSELVPCGLNDELDLWRGWVGECRRGNWTKWQRKHLTFSTLFSGCQHLIFSHYQQHLIFSPVALSCSLFYFPFLLFAFFFRIPHHWIYNLHLWLCVATFHLVLSLLQHCRL